MILSFKTHFQGMPTNFPKKILNKQKIHTIRLDPRDRWQVGRKIHFATGVRTKAYNQFAEGVVSRISHIEFSDETMKVVDYDVKELMSLVKTDLRLEDIVAYNDGFNSYDEFKRWFNKPFSGKIIWWDLDKLSVTDPCADVCTDYHKPCTAESQEYCKYGDKGDL